MSRVEGGAPCNGRTVFDRTRGRRLGAQEEDLSKVVPIKNALYSIKQIKKKI